MAIPNGVPLLSASVCLKSPSRRCLRTPPRLLLPRPLLRCRTAMQGANAADCSMVWSVVRLLPAGVTQSPVVAPALFCRPVVTSSKALFVRMVASSIFFPIVLSQIRAFWSSPMSVEQYETIIDLAHVALALLGFSTGVFFGWVVSTWGSK